MLYHSRRNVLVAGVVGLSWLLPSRHAFAADDRFSSLEKTRLHVIKLLKKEKWVKSAKALKDSSHVVRIIPQSPDQATINGSVHNLFLTINGSSDKRYNDEQVALMLVAYRQSVEGVAFDKKALVPLLRHAFYLGEEDAGPYIKLLNSGGDTASYKADKPFRSVQGDLIQMLALDTTASLQLVTNQFLKYEGVSTPEAWDAASANILRIVGKPSFENVGRGVTSITAPKNPALAGSLWFEPSLFNLVEESHGSDFLVAYPRRTAIYVAKAGESGAIDTLLSIIEETASEDHYQSAMVFQRSGQSFKPVAVWQKKQ